MPGHGAGSRAGVAVPGGARGCCRRPKVSMMIMCPPQQGHGGRRSPIRSTSATTPTSLRQPKLAKIFPGQPSVKNPVFDYCITDSDVERDFGGELDTSAEVEVYAKLPKGFLIPTPVGDYNPDWAIEFRVGSVKHIYFVSETKGSMPSLALRDLERAKIDCARKFFASWRNRTRHPVCAMGRLTITTS